MLHLSKLGYICDTIGFAFMNSVMKNQFIGFHLDFVGFSASLLCAIHCAALPFLLTMAPLAGLRFLDNPWIEYAIIILSVFIASRALIHSYLKHHKKLLALIVALAGFILIGTGQLLHVEHAEWQEVLFTSVGGTTVAVAHLINWRHIKKSRIEFPDCL